MTGHNKGPAMDSRAAWRRHCWGKARKQLLPKLPIEVIRGRVRRAKEIGLDYKTYASVRASTGRDVIGFLFSTNALRLLRQDQVIAADRADKLARLVHVNRLALVIAPLDADRVLRKHRELLDGAAKAPAIHASWSEAATSMDKVRGDKMPADAVLMVGDTVFERDWATAGRLAGYLEASRFFTASGG